MACAETAIVQVRGATVQAPQTTESLHRTLLNTRRTVASSCNRKNVHNY